VPWSEEAITTNYKVFGVTRVWESNLGPPIPRHPTTETSLPIIQFVRIVFIQQTTNSHTKTEQPGDQILEVLAACCLLQSWHSEYPHFSVILSYPVDWPTFMVSDTNSHITAGHSRFKEGHMAPPTNTTAS